MELLKGKIDSETARSVRALLDKFGMRLSGVEKGREIARVALQGKEEKIAALEADVEKKKAVIKMMADM